MVLPPWCLGFWEMKHNAQLYHACTSTEQQESKKQTYDPVKPIPRLGLMCFKAIRG